MGGLRSGEDRPRGRHSRPVAHPRPAPRLGHRQPRHRPARACARPARRLGIPRLGSGARLRADRHPGRRAARRSARRAGRGADRGVRHPARPGRRARDRRALRIRSRRLLGAHRGARLRARGGGGDPVRGAGPRPVRAGRRDARPRQAGGDAGLLPSARRRPPPARIHDRATSACAAGTWTRPDGSGTSRSTTRARPTLPG